MAAFDVVIDRFADVVENAGPFGDGGVQSEFGCHNAHELRRLDGVLQYVLGIAVAEFEAAENTDQFRGDPVDA